MTYHDDPRTCAGCGIDLFPNHMEGNWEHFHQNNGCRFDGKAAHSTEGEPQTNVEMLGPFRSELAEPEPRPVAGTDKEKL